MFLVFGSHSQNKADFKKVTVLSSSLPPLSILSTVQGQRRIMLHGNGGVAVLAEFNSWALGVFLSSRQTSPRHPSVMKSTSHQMNFSTGL